MMEHWKLMRKHKLYHPVIWLLFFGGWYYFRVNDYPNEGVALKITLVKVMVLASLVYFTNYFLIPRLLTKKKYILFSLIYTISIVALGLFKIYFIVSLLQPYFNVPVAVFTNFKARFYDNIIPLFLLVSTGAAAKLVQQYVKTLKKLSALSQEKISAELQFLRSQTNPHFLFNSLNAIYFLIDKENTEARQALLQFSEMLRYQLYDCNADTIEIEKEITYLNDYIRLQQLRREKHYEITLRVDDDLEGFRIAPLLLLPLVENAFKHISHHAHLPNRILIEIHKQNDFFQIRVENSKEAHQRNTDTSRGIGLANIKRRLELLYPAKYKLDVLDGPEQFVVNLTLQV
jgi:two-component system, LytTR family, sensor kinase